MEKLLRNSGEGKVMLKVMDHKSNVRWEGVAIKFHCWRQSTSPYDVIASKANWYINCPDYDRKNISKSTVSSFILSFKNTKFFIPKCSIKRRDFIRSSFMGFIELYAAVL
jgi:hypothetical protein